MSSNPTAMTLAEADALVRASGLEVSPVGLRTS